MTNVVLKYILRLILLATFIFGQNVIESNEKELGKTFTFLHSIVEFLLFLTIVNIVTALLIMVYRLRKNIPYKFTDNVITGINNLYYLIVTFGIIMMVLGFWGIDFKSLLTSLSIVAAAIAIISKDYVAAIISGIIISFSKEINIDDYVKLGENKGKIIDINLTKVALLNDDDDIIYIPNEKVYMSEIINYTRREIRKLSIEFELDLRYLNTVEDLERYLIDALKDFHHLIEPNSFYIKIVEVHHEYLSLKFQYKLKEVDREVEKLIRRKTIRLIANSLKLIKADDNLKN